ncbi:hypothetical protein BDW59DRAFT_165941 [Aspergillus cavernicola]|uniref:Ankyrin repeat-containing domain protein n=1 Tax=Aspergillus cavernicola TaxID=176166 RepID=A0ABR4HPL2_9EURO
MQWLAEKGDWMSFYRSSKHPWNGLYAAVAGYEVAFEEFTSAGTNRERKAEIVRLRALHRFHSWLAVDDLSDFQKLLANIPKPQLAEALIVNDNRDTILHWAAYLNLEGHLDHLIDQDILDINIQNEDGDTPLIIACSIGNLEAALCLLRAGSQVNLVNKHNETCLHYLWKFTDDEGRILLHELLRRGIDCDIEAVSKKPSEPLSPIKSYEHVFLTADLHPLPVLSGKAIQRLAGRGRTALLRDFLSAAPPTDPRNGNLTRQMIRWASTLTFPEMRALLVDYAKEPTNTTAPRDVDMAWYSVHIEDTTFEVEGIPRGYMDAVAQGWVSIRGDGWKSPDLWWRICCHGSRWTERLQDCMDAIISNTNKDVSSYQSTLLFSLQISSLIFFRRLLHTYTDVGAKDDAYNSCQGNFTYDSSKSTTIGAGREFHGPTRRPIGQILCEDGRSLLHLTIMMGLRQAFLMLIHEFNADIKLLAQHPGSDHYPAHTLNSYSLFAVYSKDAWFLTEFLRSGLQHDYCGSELGRKRILLFGKRSEFSQYIPPLVHAFDYGYHFLVRFLLDHGAQLQEAVNSCTTIFEYILSPSMINKGTIRFLFSKNGYYQVESGDMKHISPSLLPESLFNEGRGIGIFQLVCYHQQRTSSDPVSVLHLIGRGHVSPRPLKLYAVCIVRFFTLVFLSACSIPLNVLVLPLAGESSTFSSVYNRTMFPKRLGRHITSSKEAKRDEDFFTQIWNELLRMFPHTQVTPRWYRVGYGFHQSRSLMTMALIGDRHLELGPWSLTTAVICQWATWSEEAEWLQSDSIAHATTEFYTKAVSCHQPSLVDIFLWDDYDFVPEDSAIAKSLHEIGHRHSLLYFLEIRAAICLLAVALPIAIFALGQLSLFSTTVSGAIILYPSLVLASLEKPYIPLLFLNVAMGAGWAFIPGNTAQTTLVIFMWLGPLLAFSVLFGMCIFAPDPDDFARARWLCTALLPGFSYTGYSPARAFAAMLPRRTSSRGESIV